jgi:hypothetical protein
MYEDTQSILFDSEIKEINYLKVKVINHISIYLQRNHIQRKDFLISIRNQLKQNRKLTVSQFKVISGFLMKEYKRSFEHIDLLFFYFQPIIKDFHTYDYTNENILIEHGYIKREPNTLEEFFN